MNKYLKFFTVFLLFVCLFCVFFVNASNFFTFAKETSIGAKGACVMELQTGRVLFEQNADEKMPMASTTKILTCLLVIERCDNLDAWVTVPDASVGIEGSSIYLRKGDRLTYRDLLYGLMFRSGNDAAVALSILIAGSVESFIDMCNSFCAEHQLLNTHYVTPNGLDDAEHYTTARDLAKLSCIALKNDVFAEIVKTEMYTMAGQRLATKEKVLKNKNKFLQTYEGADGVKIGYTQKAGKCFVGSATRNGMHLVGAFLNVDNMFDVCACVFDSIFKTYAMTEVLPPYYHFGSMPIAHGEKDYVHIVSKKPFMYPLSLVEKNLLIVKITLDRNLKAPIEKNQAVGKVEIYLGNNLIFSSKIYTMERVESNSYFATLQKVLQNF